ncbi:MAG: ribosomal-processing cysteine protease Prp [Clostridia bacterium]
MTGHSGYGPAGADIVCAAVSMLAATLIQAALEAWGMLEAVETLNERDGDVCLDITTTDAGRGHMHSVFHAILCGYKLLEKKYPQCVAVGRKSVCASAMVGVRAKMPTPMMADTSQRR